MKILKSELLPREFNGCFLFAVVFIRPCQPACQIVNLFIFLYIRYFMVTPIRCILLLKLITKDIKTHYTGYSTIHTSLGMNP